MIRLDDDGRLCVDVVDPGQALPLGRYIVELKDAYVRDGFFVERLSIVEPVEYANREVTLSTQ